MNFFQGHAPSGLKGKTAALAGTAVRMYVYTYIPTLMVLQQLYRICSVVTGKLPNKQEATALGKRKGSGILAVYAVPGLYTIGKRQ